jgi:cation-transporting ATPase 13A2
MFVVQLFAFIYVTWQPWYEPYEESPDEDEIYLASYQNTAVFTVSSFQYLMQAVIYSKGSPFRENMLQNCTF